MTVSSQISEESYGPGAGTVLPLPFRFFNNSEISVTKVDDTTGAATVLTLGVDYTLTGAGEPEVNGNATGTVVLSAAIPVGFHYVVARTLALEQLTDLINQGKFFPEIHESTYDRLVMMIQQLYQGTLNSLQKTVGGFFWDFLGLRAINLGDPVNGKDAANKDYVDSLGSANSNRALRVPSPETIPALPAAASRANRLLSFDASGNPQLIIPDPGSASALALLLADATDPVKGAAAIGRNFQVVQSIAALRLLLKTSASKFAFAIGYYAQGDGGGGPYYYDAADTTSADNGGSIIVAADGGRWKLVHNGTLSVKQFGAKGDGTTDDTAKIQAAINAFPNGGGQIIAPAATYLLTATLNITKGYMAFRGDGAGTTTLKRTTNYGDTFLVQAVAPTQIDAIEISGLNIWASTKPTSGSHINAIAATRLKLSNLNMGESFVGITLQGCWQPSIHKVYMTNAPVSVAPTNVTGLILAKAPGGYPITHGGNVNVVGLEIYSGYTIGTNLPGWDIAVDTRAIDGAWFNNCYFGSCNSLTFSATNNDATAGVWNTGVLVTNSWFDLGKSTAIQTIGTAGSNFGNYLFSNNVLFGGNDGASGMNISGSMVGFSFTGNRISNYKASGIAVNGASVSNVEITGNTIRDVNTSGGGSGHGIWVIAGTTINISGNTLQTGTACNGIQLNAGSRITLNGNNCHGFVNGINVNAGPTQYVITSNNTVANSGSGIIDSGGAVSKVVANNL